MPAGFSPSDYAALMPEFILAVWIGIYPTPFLTRLDTAVDKVVARVSPQYAAAKADCNNKPALSKWQLAPCGPDEAAPIAKAPAADTPSKPAGGR